MHLGTVFEFSFKDSFEEGNCCICSFTVIEIFKDFPGIGVSFGANHFTPTVAAPDHMQR